MDDKISPELKLAMDADGYMPYSSLYLGYNASDDSWMLIIRHSGDIDDLEGDILNSCVYLLGGYAIVNVYSYNIKRLQEEPRVLYIDKAQYYSYGAGVAYDRYISCITENFMSKYGLTGEGVCIGIIDSGVNILNREFVDDAGSRIVMYWNQNTDYERTYPNRYGLGRIYDQSEIGQMYEDRRLPSVMGEQHGTEVASVAAGSNIGVAGKARIIVVEQSLERALPDTIGIMMGIDLLVRYSMETGTPVVINLSYGNNFGAHDGTSTLELFVNSVAQMAKVCVVTGSGNDGGRQLHTSGMLGNVSYASIDIAVAAGVKNFGLQIWKNYIDSFDVLVYSPSYDLVAYLTEGQIVSGAYYGSTELLGIFQGPSPYNVKQLIYVFFQSETGDIEQGIWHVRIAPKSIANGIFNAYLPGDSYVTGQVAFENPSVYGTLTIPGTASNIITVAAYDQVNASITGFSGRGFTSDNAIKPDIAAPGVGVTVSYGEYGYGNADGTSLAAAFVSGCAALIMEWGIVLGNDPYMYGERVKAQLIRGAKSLGSLGSYPNRYTGWGTVCMENSFKGLIV